MHLRCRRPLLAALALVTGLVVASPAAADVALPEGTTAPRTAPVPRAEPRATPAERALARMTLRQQVGQLFMVGTRADRIDARTRAQIRRFHVGNVMLTGRSRHGVRAPARVARAMTAQVSPAATSRVGLFVGTDQEGGLVRVLQGPGFSRIPTALDQGRWAPARLRSAARRWARELGRVGVNLNLAPVLDTVPSRRAARHNPPIGHYDRQFGFTPRVVASHGLAFMRGMARADVTAVVKHFPGLGRVRANTDTSGNVVDHVTRRHDAFLAPFRAAVDAGAPFVMMSTARYTHLDPARPAAFSPYVVGTMLRGDLGFDGVVISDDLAHARQVAGIAPAQRALRFIAAGGDMVLTVDAAPLPAMYGAVLSRARDRTGFRTLVRDAALRVLTAKQERGLLPKPLGTVGP
ncbi:glycoside hydrolase family 3 N-terminal domain-containing protein [Nocardioides sp. YIM 152315]|uniref:glycoside hydrolase family 3 N-terminal domain-containing protein n=1 Tax=Nocardioides sp. YIM 152315 TaxID=3031760 RepID=UPI0023DA8411|nr:glycoside hydrolase family 3 N-terminal domain-containing protein [Nocardioides sp. YIM 152315]MDF1604277.1 glycoside hydrolase family 3 N-terminal domain-containing protein [Nocardioides sp. YIM 152315]